MQMMQPADKQQSSENPPRPWITVRDQGSLVALVASLLVMLGCFWLTRGGHQGRLIDVDRASPLQAQFHVDINRADWPEMIQLPGIGETLARRVIVERRLNGPFRDVDEITRVRGIGRRTLERIRPYLMPIPKDTDWAAANFGEAESVQ